MEDVENLVKTSIGEIQKLLTAKTVVGEPMEVEGTTLIPLISIGFGFGAGGGEGKGDGRQKGEGIGGGAGGGAGIKPVAIIIINKDGSVRVEAVKGSFASALEKMAEAMPQMMDKCCSRWMERQKEAEEEES